MTYESAEALSATLSAVRVQMRTSDELVVVDNGSTDGSVEVARAITQATVVELGRNSGFAAGCHAGAAASSAPLLFFLNPDSRLAPGGLDALRDAATAHPRWAAWQALVTLAGGEHVNSSGGMTHWLGFGWAGDCNRPVAAVADRPREVSFASGAALVVRREAWDRVGGFDPAYFMYGEDLDLSLRLRLAGWGVGSVPSARVEHDYAFAKGNYKWFYLERNRWWTVIGAYPLPLFVLRSLPWALRRRRRTQALRRSSTRAFATGLTASLDSPYLADAARVPVLMRMQAGYWAAARAMVGARA